MWPRGIQCLTKGYRSREGNTYPRWPPKSESSPTIAYLYWFVSLLDPLLDMWKTDISVTSTEEVALWSKSEELNGQPEISGIHRRTGIPAVSQKDNLERRTETPHCHCFLLFRTSQISGSAEPRNWKCKVAIKSQALRFAKPQFHVKYSIHQPVSGACSQEHIENRNLTICIMGSMLFEARRPVTAAGIRKRN